jgi:hypothetical protein
VQEQDGRARATVAHTKLGLADVDLLELESFEHGGSRPDPPGRAAERPLTGKLHP